MKKPSKKVIILTGPSGSGKSSVAALLAHKGFRILNADRIAQGLYAPGRPCNARLRRVFGGRFFDEKGRVDRKVLGALVFAEPAALKRLNAILYPALIVALKRLLRSAKRKVCVDMAVYFDAGAPRLASGAQVWLVDAPLALRVRRLRRKGIDAARARRQAAALSFGPKAKAVAQVRLLNKGTLSELKRKLNFTLRENDPS